MKLHGLTPKQWEEMHVKTCVRSLREMESEDLLWTPIGCYKAKFLDILFNKEILEDTEDARFFIWKGYEGYKKWIKFKELIYTTIFKGDPKYISAGYYIDDSDYIASFITKNTQISEKEYKGISEHIEECSKIIPTEKELQNYKLLKKYEAMCQSIEIPK